MSHLVLHPLRVLLLWCSWFGLGVLCHGTTVRPPTFDELVQRADHVVHGKVIAIEFHEDTYQGQVLIRTEVSIAVTETVVGPPVGEVLTLRMLGGEAGGRRMTVGGMPTFRRGEEVVIFERGNGRTVCPLVFWRYGHYRVSRTASGESPRVRRADFTPLETVGKVGAPLFQPEQQSRAFQSDAALALSEFKAEIRRRRTAGGRRE